MTAPRSHVVRSATTSRVKRIVSHVVADRLRSGDATSPMAKAARTVGPWPVPRAKLRDVAPCPVCKAAAPRLDNGAFRCVHGHTFTL